MANTTREYDTAPGEAKPMNYGKSWKGAEQQLVDALDRGVSITEVARLLGRSESATAYRMKTILYEKHKKGEQLSPYYGRWPVTEAEMQIFIANFGAYAPHAGRQPEDARLEQRVADLEDELNKLKVVMVDVLNHYGRIEERPVDDDGSDDSPQ